jgi:hypothetical protein
MKRLNSSATPAGKPDIDVTRLSKEYTREQWNQTGVATTERGEQRRRDRHTESEPRGEAIL